jgi:hypothetical protein
MRCRNPVTAFWLAVLAAVATLGIAWTAWKTISTEPLAVSVAIPATLLCIAATFIAGRIIIAVARASRVASRPRSDN